MSILLAISGLKFAIFARASRSISGLLSIATSRLESAANNSTMRPVPVPTSRTRPKGALCRTCAKRASTSESAICNDLSESHSSACAAKYCAAISVRALRTSSSRSRSRWNAFACDTSASANKDAREPSVNIPLGLKNTQLPSLRRSKSPASSRIRICRETRG